MLLEPLWGRLRLPLVELALALLPGVSTAARTDLVVLHNGSRITGEAENERGWLAFKADEGGGGPEA